MNLLNWQECEELPIEEVWDLYRKYVSSAQVDLISSFGFGRELVDYAEGCWIYKKDGGKVLDFTGGIGVLNHGHNHPRILDTRIEFQKRKRMEVHKNYFSPYVAGLSQNLAKLLPGDLNISYFPNSGAEAVEGAIKMAYKYHGGARSYVLHADISFHGKLLGAASITGSPELDFEFPHIGNTKAFEYNNISSLKKAVEETRLSNGDSAVYALIVEPFSASSLRKCSEEFLLEIRRLCTEEDIVLIFDEVYTGWAKTGSLFYFARYNSLVPDIVTMAKSFGGGKASISGYVASERVYRKAYDNLNDATLHSTTYYGFGEETATAIEAINIVIEDNYVEKAKHIEARIEPALKSIQSKYPNFVKEVRGCGALHGLILNPGTNILQQVSKIVPSKFFSDSRFAEKVVTAAVIQELYESHGVLTFYGSNREIPLIVSPSLVVNDDEIDIFIGALDKTLAKGMITLVLRLLKSKFFK